MTKMQINSDFSLQAITTPDDYDWIASPQPGVERVMLDRIGNEQARATSLVRYAPGSAFPEHSHPGGEEILVLSGVFTENGVDYPAGWYLRSPDSSSHQPSSYDGATLFVKLRQMSVAEREAVRLNTNDMNNWHDLAQRKTCLLFTGTHEAVVLLMLQADERVFCAPLAGGAEILVLKGGLCMPEGQFREGSWLRFPPGEAPALTAALFGTLIYLKTGHLAPDTLIGAVL